MASRWVPILPAVLGLLSGIAGSWVGGTKVVNFFAAKGREEHTNMKSTRGRRILRRTPSPAMVVACLALTVALSGAGYAAIVLPANSVGSTQLKRGAVAKSDVRAGAITRGKVRADAITSAKVLNNALTGSDVNEATLGQVPAAASSANSDMVDGLHANQLVRATTAIDHSDNDNFDTCAFTTVLTKAVTAPTAGILLVWGNAWAQRDLDDPDMTAMEARITVDAVAATSESRTHLGNDASQNDLDGFVAPSGAVPVAAGTRNADLQIRECSGGMAFIAEKSITTLFVPFGNAGSPGALSLRSSSAGAASPQN
jgi:hypothetical protein